MAEHWYSRAGEPAYQQVTQKGGLRATDLRDARKLGLVPSVTTVLAVVAKPQLEKWKRDQSVMAALTLPRHDGETEDTLLRRIYTDSEAQAKAAAEEGTRIHDAIEQYFKEGYPATGPYISHVRATRAELSRLFPDVSDWVPEASFASGMGYGGKVDLHSDQAVIDFKTKDFGPNDKVVAYDEQIMQLDAYRHGLRIPQATMANVYISRTCPGEVRIIVHEEGDHYQRFCLLLEYWKLSKKYNPLEATA